jgi:cyclase
VELLSDIHAHQPSFTSDYFDVHTYNTFVHLLIAKPEMYAGGNVAVIELGEGPSGNGGVLLFDTFVSPEANADLHDFIYHHLSRTIQCAVNSHHHLEHALGNYSIPASTPIISGPITLQKLQEEGMPLVNSWKDQMADCYSEYARQYVQIEDESLSRQMHENLRLYQRMQKENFQLRVPSMIFQDSLRVPGDTFTCEIHNLGAGHSEEDTVIIVPELKIALIGDLINANFHDTDRMWYALHRASEPKQVLSHLNWLLSQDIEIFLLGHGEAVGKLEIMEYQEQLAEILDLGQ